ncbi:MAG: STAS domain-containing protein [Lachnospiraceae bacterium]|nr:STAS domain-containing protein [Lachnospiraceae bacterium]
MTIQDDRNGSSLTVKVGGRLDTTTAPELDTHLASALDGVKDLVFDFSDLEYISSAGLRVLLATVKRMNKQGTMVVKNANEIVKEVFDVTGFMDILNVQ